MENKEKSFLKWQAEHYWDLSQVIRSHGFSSHLGFDGDLYITYKTFRNKRGEKVQLFKKLDFRISVEQLKSICKQLKED